MNEVQRKQSSANFVDKVIGYFAPQVAMRRHFARTMVEMSQRWSIRGKVGGRLERPASQGSRRGVYANETDYFESLSQKARELTDQNPVAEAMVGRLVEAVVGDQVTMIARTSNKEWNKKHKALWDRWVETESDVRGMDDFSGLVAHIVHGVVEVGRTGAILLKSGGLQLVESHRIETPFEMLRNENVVNGVELNKFGRPVKFWINTNPLEPAKMKFVSVDADNMVYFARRKQYGDTSGRTAFGTSFDTFEHVDATIEAVIVAAQMAANFGLIVTGDQAATQLLAGTTAGSNAAGAAARMMHMEPGMVKYLQGNQKIDQIKAEQPGQNLTEFLREVQRFGLLPAGVPLELLAMDFSKINYSGARSMYLAFNQVVKAFRARYLYPGLRRIYRWRTSKWIKSGELPEPPEGEAWNLRIIPPARPWVDPTNDAQATNIAIDLGLKSRMSAIHEQGEDAEQVWDEISEERKTLESKDIPIAYSTRTRPEDMNNGDGEDPDASDTDTKDDSAKK